MSTRSSKRQVIDHVSVPRPTRSSSRAVKNEPVEAEDVLLLTDEEDTKASLVQTPPPAPARGRGRGRASAASKVKFEPEPESEEEQPLAKTSTRKGKGKAKAIVISSDDDGDEGSDFVLSEEDVKPTPSAVNRAAMLRAAERRMAFSSSTELPTPLASGTSTPLADKVWDGSESEAEESDFLSDLSDSPAPKKNGKGKAAANGKGKGRRLDGGEGEDLPEAWRGKKKRGRRETDAEAAEKAEIKKHERKLAAKLGRKLTQGEKNQIRLQRVSSPSFLHLN